jgi:hypothetical protein
VRRTGGTDVAAGYRVDSTAQLTERRSSSSPSSRASDGRPDRVEADGFGAAVELLIDADDGARVLVPAGTNVVGD